MKTAKVANVFKVARWEFTKNVRTPTFLVLTFILPLIMVLVAAGGYFFSMADTDREMTLGVVDETGQFESFLLTAAAESSVNVNFFEGDLDQLQLALEDGEYAAIVHIHPENLTSGEFTLDVTDIRDINMGPLRAVFSQALSSQRLETLGLQPEQAILATAPPLLTTRVLGGDDEPLATVLMPLIIAMTLILSVVFSGQILMYGVITEKRNRVVEILLSSISAAELLWGKLVGLGMLGLIQITIWLGTAVIVASRFFDLTRVGLTWTWAGIYFLYFVFGYLLLSSLFAAMGATMKDVEGGSQAQGLIVLIPLSPLFFANVLFAQPNSLIVRILSHVPPFNTTIVLLRMIGTQLPSWEIVSTLSVLFLSALGFMYIAARIFDGGLLQFDRNLGLKEIRKILRQNG